MAGDPKIMPSTYYRLQRLERNVRTGRPYPLGTSRWGIDTALYKSEIQARWSMDRRGTGVWWLPSDILKTNGGEDYLRQVTNEREIQEIKNGRKLMRWEPISHEVGVDYWDTEVYARCLADMVTGREWRASAWGWLSGESGKWWSGRRRKR